ncbi:major facilitator superfamily domain-containing protein [Pelagophyceae sp. CCMP2097]|nr:major facilitator superfamily domain-containing protein [Pelagophyceae sp. CCMP2097]
MGKAPAAGYGAAEVVVVNPLHGPHSAAPALEIELPLQAKGGASFAVMGFLCMLSDSPRGLMFPTLWPLVSSLGGTKASQGIIVAAFSFGRVLVSPVYGEASTRYGYRGVLILAHVIILFGALLFTRVNSLATLFFAQVLLGIGCGTLGVTRAYVAESVPKAQRTVFLGRLTAMQYAGFTTTPFMGSLISKVGARLAPSAPQWLAVSGLTFVSYAVAAAALVAIWLLKYRFVDLRQGDFQAMSAATARMPAATDAPDRLVDLPDAATRRREVGFMLAGLLLNVVTKGSIGCYETLGVVFAEVNLDLDGQAVGYVVSVCGACGVIALLSFKPLARLFDDVELMIYGILVMVLACLLLVTGLRPKALAGDGTALWATAIALMYAVGYPIGHTAVIGWFSKATGKRPQGMLMGLFASAGSLARIVFPICSGFLAQHHGMDAVFIALSVLLGATLLIMTVHAQAFRDAIL